LYDYQTDSDETKNLAGERPEIVASLRAVLARQPEAKPQVRAAGGPAGKKIAAAASNSKQDRAAMFAKRDSDGDGRLTRDEFLTGQPDPDEAPQRFLRFDADQDGLVSREEFIRGGSAKK
jgi:iduronate 2-sulfatase